LRWFPGSSICIPPLPSYKFLTGSTGYATIGMGLGNPVGCGVARAC
jgi:hypothetical protein